jgi:hypothetical protein
MIEKLKLLIEALREELKHHGEMLALIDQNSSKPGRRSAPETSRLGSAVREQAKLIRAAGQNRELHQRQLAASLGQPENALLQSLISLLPRDYRPLVVALAEENHQLSKRVQRSLRNGRLPTGPAIRPLRKPGHSARGRSPASSRVWSRRNRLLAHPETETET